MEAGTVIVGAGHAGFAAAAALRTEQYQGAVTLIGAEADLPYQRPPLSKSYLKGDVESDSILLRPPSFYRDQRIDLRLGEKVESVECARKLLTLKSGESVAFDKLVLATGARARKLQVPGADLPGVVEIRTLIDAKDIVARLPSTTNVAVIGGGFVGMEFAASATSFGKRVTVLEAAALILGRSIAPITSSHILDWHRSRGVKVILNARVTRIEGDERGVRNVVSDEGTRIPAELVLVAIGAESNVDLAVSAGLVCENGVVVDEQLRTSAADIYCVGDSSAHKSRFSDGRRIRLESIQNATDQARAVARSLTGKDGRYDAVPWFWSDQANLKLQTVGLSFDADNYVVRGSLTDGRFSVFHYRGPTLVAVDSINQPGDHIIARHLISKRLSLDPDRVGDVAHPLKSLIPA